ncbi:MAG: Radical domain protein [Bryobacterales bacterium]|nr:Radical domain protein [Bryobacterales bacterium]
MSGSTSLLGGLDLQEELSPGAFALPEGVIHNQSVVIGCAPMEITTPGDQWAYAVTFPLCLEACRRAGKELLCVRVEAEVTKGRVGIGYVAEDHSTYLSVESDRTPEDGDTVFNVVIEHQDRNVCGWLVVRNTAEGGSPSRIVIRSLRTFRTGATRIPDLVEVEPLRIPRVPCETSDGSREASYVGGLGNGKTRRFQVLLTHTSRSWDWTRCSRDFIAQRGADPNRLRNLPPFEKLPPSQSHLYSGGLTVLEVAVDKRGANVVARRFIDSHFKIQHAGLVGRRLVLCFENFLAVLPTIDEPVGNIDLRPGSPWRIDDPWFNGLHTVFPVTDDVCIVSSSSADAVLWVDLRSRKVIRRWRLPADIYGFNYDLTPSMSVVDHYIHNDIQLGHLNCAYPDGRGGCYVSTLFQGDIGHVDQNGRYSLLARGQVGCHGVRLAQNGRDIYFADSCGGRLMRVEPGGGASELWAAGSRWLHDVEQVDADLYLFCLGDKNEIAVVDVSKGEERGRFALDCRGVNVQFATVARTE